MAEYRTHTALAGPRCWRIWFLALPVWTAVVLAQAPPAKVPTKEDEDLKALLPRLKPLEPAEALRSFRIEKGFRIELAAAEPGVTDPIAAAFDENGRLYVAEMGDYPNAPKEGERPFGRVRLLEDTNGDGRFDKSTVFAEGLPAPSGIACWQGGVFVAAAPDIWYFKDTDGDGKADIAQKVYTGFGTGKHTYPVLNNLHWGLDNKIYGVSSYAGGTISRVEKPGPTVSVRRQGFRFNPVSGAFEAVPGNAEFGNTFDDWGNRFVCHATVMVFHCLLPGPYWEHNPHVPAMTATQPLTANFAPVFPISKPEPWKVARERFWKRWVNTTPDMRAGRFPPSELAPSGFTTASSGVTIYRGAAFPPAYRGNAFTGEPANNLVCRHILEPAGVGFRARRAGDKQEFLASSDNWFRPVNFLNGPDGCLYVLDMYREVIEDDSAIPDDILRHLDLTSGRDRGRIYRIVPEGFQRPPQPRLGREDTRALVALLDRPDAWWRETAQRLLVERRDPAVVEPLRALARTAARSEARLHALWTLEGLGALDEETLLGALEASEARLREHGLRLAESRLNDAQRLRDQVLARATDAAPRVRFQTALTLAGAKDPRAAEALATIARRDADEPASRLAVLIGSSNHAGALFAALASDEPFLRRSAGLELLKQLAQVVGARNQPGELATALAAMAAPNPGAQDPRTIALVRSLADGLRQARNPLPDVLAKLTATQPSVAVALQALLLRAGAIAAADQQSVERRVEAIGLLAHGTYEQATPVLLKLLSPREPQVVQLASVQGLANWPRKEVGAALVERWRSLSPPVQREVAQVLIRRAELVSLLLDAVRDKRIAPADLDPVLIQALLKYPDDPCRRRAAELLAASPKAERAKVLAHYVAALRLPGDAGRGAQLFTAKCAACHKLGDRGHEVGPDLAAGENQSAEALLINILDPNREVKPSYQNYLLATKDGKVLTGIIAAETPSSLTLRRAEAVEEIVRRQDIEELTSTGLSLMPEGLEKDIDLQQMADLIRFLLDLKERPAKP